MTHPSPIPARTPSRATGSGGHVPPGVVAAPSAPSRWSFLGATNSPSATVEGLFSHPRRTRAISGSDCFGRPTRPNGGCFNRGNLAAGNASGTPFVTDCLSYASARSCHRAEAHQPESRPCH